MQLTKMMQKYNWCSICYITFISDIKRNWRAPWKNRISSTNMKLRKSLVKPVTRQTI